MIRMMMVVVIIPGWNIEKTFGHRTSWLVDCPSLLLVVFVCFCLFERTRKGNMLQLQVGCPNVHVCFLGNSENSLVFSEQVFIICLVLTGENWPFLVMQYCCFAFCLHFDSRSDISKKHALS